MDSSENTPQPPVNEAEGAAEPASQQPAMPTFGPQDGAAGMAYGAGVMGGGSAPAPRKRRWLLPVVVAVLLVVLAGGYVLAFYLPNRPQNVYSKGLANSGKALDKLTAYFQDQSKADYASASLDATLKYTSPTISVDGDMNGSFDKKGDGTLQMHADVAGEKFTANVRSIKSSGNSSPDFYLQVSGIKPLLESFGTTQYDSLDGQWIAIDHTLIDSVASNISQNAEGSGADMSNAPTPDQVNDAVQAVQQVNREYIFTTDKNKAVLQYKSFKGKETMDGRSVNHYVAGYDQDHLKAYIGALGTALDGSKLNSWSKQVNKKNLSEALNIKSVQNDVKQNGYAFDVWVDTKQKLIHALQFRGPDQKNDTFTIAQNYTGGDTYPFTISTVTKQDNGTTTGKFTATLNTATNKVTATADASEKSSDGTSEFKMNLSVTPGKDMVKVSAPSGSKPLAEILNQLGLGGLYGSSLEQGALSPSSSVLSFKR